MAECTICNLCERGYIENADEVKQIPSNVRKFQNRKFTIWRCPYCRTLHSKEDIDKDEFYRYYPLKEHKLDLWARAGYNTYLKRLVDEGMKIGHEILDYGCGQGLLVSFLHEKGYSKTEGYDPYVPQFSDRRLIARAYDVVIAQDVIEHDDEPRRLMEQLVQLLRPGGILCVGTPNADHIYLSSPEKFATSLHQPYHRHILTGEVLKQLGQSIGLKVGKVYHRYYYDTIFPMINYRFLQTYIMYAGNVFDAAVEPPRIKMVLTSPVLLFYAFFGYFFPPRTEMMVFFHRK